MPSHAKNGVKRRIKFTDHKKFLRLALAEAKKGLAEGGIPIGSLIVSQGKILGQGRNQRVQKNSCVLHAEMDCLENAGRLSGSAYRNTILYSTLSPCDMCSGAILLYGIPHVVIGDSVNFKGPEEYLRSRGVKVEVLNDKECVEIMKTFIEEHPYLWNEDIGV